MDSRFFGQMSNFALWFSCTRRTRRAKLVVIIAFQQLQHSATGYLSSNLCPTLSVSPLRVSEIQSLLTPVAATHPQLERSREARNSPVTPFTATHTRHLFVNPLPATHTKNRGVGGRLWLTSMTLPLVVTREGTVGWGHGALTPESGTASLGLGRSRGGMRLGNAA